MKTKKRELFNIVLIHVARTWERIRVQQDFEEMPLDNLESLEVIEEIANDIMEDEHIIAFLKTREDDYFITHTDKMSDTYIEDLAEEIIKENYL